jgi:hypothetical protein
MRWLLAVAASLAILAPAEAGDRKDKKASAGPVKGTAENGQDVKRDVATLTTAISWKTSLSDAKELARKEGKMVFWMHMLGDLNGAT